MKQIDRIRNMNVEEMILFICGIMAHDVCIHCIYKNGTNDCYNKGEFHCDIGIKAWLESEVEE